MSDVIAANNTEDQANGQTTKVKEKPKAIRPDIKLLVDMFTALEELDFITAISILKQVANDFKENRQHLYLISPVQLMGVSLTVFSNALYYMV